jgi:hypothetical protein
MQSDARRRRLARAPRLSYLRVSAQGLSAKIVHGGNAMVVVELVSLIHLGKVPALPHPTV